MFNYNDQVSIKAISGDGGSGLASFLRTKKQARGGPDGGDGGRGGDVFLQSSFTVSDFEHLKPIRTYRASGGAKGGNQLKNGKNGKDLKIFIPVGTLVKNINSQVLMDFDREKKERLLIGGEGGKGNAFFKSSRNQAPRRFQKGKKGETLPLILELKPLIDLALIGKVNTGKSSFFNLTTRSQSKVGAYPYSTLVPHIGQLKVTEESCFIMDTPGLERGASKSLSQGLSFLRSIQRAKILLHFLDSGQAFLKDINDINQELEKFDKKHSSSLFTKLSSKKRFYIISKADQLKNKTDTQNKIKTIKLKKQEKLFFISNKTKEGLTELIEVLKKELKLF